MVIILIAVLFLLFGRSDYFTNGESYPTVVWWTPLTGDYNELITCGTLTCLFTDVRDAYNKSDVQAFIFYGSNINNTDLPLPRSKTTIWGLLHEESPKNQPYLQHECMLKHWNYTSTFSRYSDLPLTLQYLKNLEILVTKKYFQSVQYKNHIKKEQNLSSIAYLQSICDASSGRDQYVKELMNYIPIDSYGDCLNNKKLPKSLKENYLQKIDSDELYKFLSNYKFLIAFENAVCNDYITEKLWRAFIIGSIPIVFGSELIEDWLPNNKSAILIKNFSNPEMLAQFINQLDNNDTAYNEYLNHKLLGHQGITNHRLLEKINEWTERSNEGLFRDFECFICNKIHNMDSVPKFANGRHYDCGEQMIFPKMQTDMKDFYWRDIMNSGKYTAYAMDELLSRNVPFTDGELRETSDKVMLSEV